METCNVEDWKELAAFGTFLLIVLAFALAAAYRWSKS